MMLKKILFVTSPVFILAAFLLTQLSLSAYMPAMPSLAHHMGVGKSQVMMTVTYGVLGYTLGQLVWGSVSDYIGRRNVVVIALLLYMVIAGLITQAQILLLFSLGYALLMFVAAAYTSVGNALLRDRYQGKCYIKMMSYVGVLMAFGPVVGPFVGIHLSTLFSWQAIFYFLLLFAAFSLLGFIFLVSPDERSDNKVNVEDKIHWLVVHKNIWLNKQFLGFAIALGLMFSSILIYISNATYLFQQYFKLNQSVTAWLLLLTCFAYAAGAIANSVLCSYLSRASLLIFGMVLALSSSVTLVLLDTFSSMGLIEFLFGIIFFLFSVGLLLPLLKLYSMSVFSTYAGTVASVMKFLQSFVAMCVTAIAAHLSISVSTMPILLLFAGLSVISLALLFSTGLCFFNKKEPA